MKISVEEKDVEGMTLILSCFKQGEELELRIREGNFPSSVGKGFFNLVLQDLKAKYPHEYKESIVEYSSNNIRKIREEGNTYYQRKEKLDTYDIFFSNFSIRLNRSKEEVLDIQDFHPRYTRVRKRFSFLLSDIVRVDMTATQSSYEIEIEFEQGNTVESILTSLKEVLGAVFPNAYTIIKLEEEKKIISEYNRNFSSSNETLIRYDNRPRNIKREDIPFMKDYSVTNKINGTTHFLFLSSYGIYLLNSSSIYRVSQERYQQNVIMQGELLDNILNIFDCIREGGNDISRIPHNRRMEIAKKHIHTLKFPFEVTLKKFLNTGNLYEDTLAVIKYMKEKYGEEYKVKNDGLIYTPNNLPFINPHTLKWKFPESMSIDFMIVEPSRDNTLWKLQNYGYNDKIVYFKEILKVEKNNPLYGLLVEGMIIECGYDIEGKFFVPWRIRYDKQKPNFIGVALDVFKDIIHPFTCTELLQSFQVDRSSLNELRKFHNYMKRLLIAEYTREKIVLDLGFGRGGDIHKYKHSQAKFVYGLEPNSDNYEEALRRIKEGKIIENNFKLLPYTAQETARILSDIKEEVNVVASFFSLSFFFSDESNLDSLVESISKSLLVGGYFIGTTIDGAKTSKFLSGKERVNTASYELIKLSEFKGNLGDKIQVHLKDTIVNTQIEYLVYFQILIDKLRAKDIVLVKTEFFNPPFSSNKELSELFRTFVFKKHKKSSIASLKIDEKEDILLYLKDKEFNFTREGVIGEGSCFIHSLLRAVNYKYFLSSIEERKEYVKQLRVKLASDLSLEKWLSLGNSSISYTLASVCFNHYTSKNGVKVPDINAHTIKEYHELLPEELKDKFIILVSELFIAFKKLVSEPSIWIGEDTNSSTVNIIESLEEYFKVNIRIFRDSTRAIYKRGENSNGNPLVCLLWLNNSHYELLGMKEGGDVTRIFSPGHYLYELLN